MKDSNYQPTKAGITNKAVELLDSGDWKFTDEKCWKCGHYLLKQVSNIPTGDLSLLGTEYCPSINHNE